MAGQVPQHQFPSTEPEKTESKGYLWIAVVLVLFVAAGVFALTRTERHTRDKAVQAASTHSQAPMPEPEEGSPFIQFSPSDILIDTSWSLLSGHNPTVRFSCRLAPEVQSAKVVILCYRTQGADKWRTVEAHPRRGHIYRITLRDLYRDMPYECFFIVHNKKFTEQSRTLRFHT